MEHEKLTASSWVAHDYAFVVDEEGIPRG
jgi:hypothetical protein